MSNPSDFHVFQWEKAPFSGLSVSCNEQSDYLIFLLHGYQGDAQSNLEFACELAQRVPDAQVVVPNGLRMIPKFNDWHKRQWWDLPEEADGSALSGFSDQVPAFQRVLIEEMVPRIHFTAGILNRFVLNVAQESGKSLKQCAVAGISQGGMTAFDMVLFRRELNTVENPLGALVIIGAGITKAERLLTPLNLPKIPVMLAGGNQDEIFPPKVNDFSENLLEKQGLPVFRTQSDSVHFGLEHTVKDAVGVFLNEIWQKIESLP